MIIQVNNNYFKTIVRHTFVICIASYDFCFENVLFFWNGTGELSVLIRKDRSFNFTGKPNSMYRRKELPLKAECKKLSLHFRLSTHIYVAFMMFSGAQKSTTKIQTSLYYLVSKFLTANVPIKILIILSPMLFIIQLEFSFY